MTLPPYRRPRPDTEPGQASRRGFLRAAGAGLAGASALAGVGCGSSARRTPATGSSNSPDVDILNTALDLENMAIAAYTAGIPLLRGDARATGITFLAHEQAHAATLRSAIRAMGGTPNQPKHAYDFGTLERERDVLALAEKLERTTVQVYVDAIPKLSHPELRATAAGIVTNEAEHVSVLLRALGESPLPHAFVDGSV